MWRKSILVWLILQEIGSKFTRYLMANQKTLLHLMESVKIKYMRIQLLLKLIKPGKTWLRGKHLFKPSLIIWACMCFNPRINIELSIWATDGLFFFFCWVETTQALKIHHLKWKARPFWQHRWYWFLILIIYRCTLLTTTLSFSGQLWSFKGGRCQGLWSQMVFCIIRINKMFPEFLRVQSIRFCNDSHSQCTFLFNVRFSFLWDIISFFKQNLFQYIYILWRFLKHLYIE